jgi:hypothetical protein
MIAPAVTIRNHTVSHTKMCGFGLFCTAQIVSVPPLDSVSVIHVGLSGTSQHFFALHGYVFYIIAIQPRALAGFEKLGQHLTTGEALLPTLTASASGRGENNAPVASYRHCGALSSQYPYNNTYSDRSSGRRQAFWQNELIHEILTKSKLHGGSQGVGWR